MRFSHRWARAGWKVGFNGTVARWSSAPGIDLPRSWPEAELLPPEEKSNWKRIQLFGYGFLGV